VAVFAAVLSVRATALVARTVLANQAGASNPDVRVLEGHTRRGLSSDTRDYVFVVSITNRSTAVRSFPEAMLRVTYRTRANFLGAVDLTTAEPLDVPAGQTTKRTLKFSTSNVIPRHCRIDAYTLLFVDAQGERLAADASLPSVLRADTDGAGPATWGWD